MILKDAPTELRDVTSIIVDRETRQRSTIDKDIEVLAEQMANAGQIQPIVIHSDGRLVAGERRLTAARKLGWQQIKCTVIEQLSKQHAFLIELLENLARKQLSWQDEARAIGNYHNMRMGDVQGWTARGTAQDIGLSDTQIGVYLSVARKLDDPDVAGCNTLQGAFNLLRGRAERATAAAQNRGMQIANILPDIQSATAGTKEERTAALSSMLGGSFEKLNTPQPQADPFAILDAGDLAAASLREAAKGEATVGDELVLNADFSSWVQTYDGPRFDVLHVDFPYGKGYTGSNTRKTGRAHIAPRYADDPDIYWTLLADFLEHQDRIAFPIAHCIFWFDMVHYAGTVESFERAGWNLVQPHPLIWCKPYQGVAADVRRRPRHCYETALMLTRGDRKLVKLEQDYFEGRADEKLHINQKSITMLKHFLKMVVDEHTAVLDPTCGSGSALAASRQLGAARILGLELDASNAEVARFVVNRPEEKSNG